MFRKLLDCAQIATDRGWRVIAPLRLLEHALTEVGSRGSPPCDLHPSRTLPARHTTTLQPPRQRLRSNRLFGQVTRSASMGTDDQPHTLGVLWTHSLSVTCFAEKKRGRADAQRRHPYCFIQFSEGLSTWSMTRTSTGAFCGTSFRPSCSWRAVKIEVTDGSVEGPGETPFSTQS